MKVIFKLTLLLFVLTTCIQCKQNKSSFKEKSSDTSQIQFAKGFSIENYDGYSIIIVKNPWPKANKTYRYILKEKNGIVPDSLQQNPIIVVPIKSIVVTSTTHIPSLEMLDEEKSLVAFPNLDYISSEKVRARIDAKKIREIGTNQSLNTEVLIDLQPNLIIGYGIDNNNATLDNLQKSGLKVMLNGDWNEETPLGKAEWIKFFGALYGKQKEANEIFSKMTNDYFKTINIAKKATTQPTVLAGDMYEDKWYLPKGTSWGSQLLKEANANYFWAETKGTGSLSLSFETVLEKAQNASVWITSGQFSSLKAMADANPHYKQFSAFQQKNVYTFTRKKGNKGGILYYELAPNRPDIVLKDIVKIMHPELFPNYELYFFEKLK
jgi:iron complex transport system substrate-binding protein